MASRKRSGSHNRAAGARPHRVGEQIRQVLGELLSKGALKDPRLEGAGLISFTEVRVTADLRSARVFTSIFPPEGEASEAAMTALQELSPRIRALVGGEVRLRHTPELKFTLDRSIERGAEMEALIRDVRAEDDARQDDDGSTPEEDS